MKKIFAFLIVALIVVSSIFAVDPNTTEAASEGAAAIRITATIAEKFPVFQLSTKTGAGAQTNNVPNATITEAAMSAAEQDKLTLSGQYATVVFSINQVSNSRCFSSYDLTVTADDLVLMRSADDTITYNTYEAAKTGAASNNEQIFTVQADVVHAAVYATATIIDVDDSDDSKLVAVYQGNFVDGTSAVEIGTATVKWNANVNALAGDYEALVTLTVTAN